MRVLKRRIGADTATAPGTVGTVAKRGSSKDRSLAQEDFIARAYGGTRSPSSGGSSHDQGDVRTTDELFECKQTGTPIKGAKSISINLGVLEKAAEEAYSEGRMPAMALRITNPQSPLADSKGHIDLVVRLVRDETGQLS